MKKLVFALALGIFALPVFAQEGPRDGADRSPEERAKMMVRKMAEELNLNDDQIEAIKPLLVEFHKERAEAKQADKKRHEEMREKLATILTEEQMEKLEAKMKERRKKMRKHRMHAEPQLESQDQ